MPTIPLRDAYRVEGMPHGREKLPVPVGITIVNPLDLKSKVSAFKSADELLTDINKTREAVESQLAEVAQEAATKHQQAAETADVYRNTKIAYQAVPEERGVCPQHLDMQVDTLLQGILPMWPS
jgi:hypothetical protein